MINNDLDLRRIRRDLTANGRVQVADFLQTDAADQLEKCLRTQVQWSTAERGLADCPSWPDEGRDARFAAAYRRASEFHFVYDRYLMVEALKEGRDPQLVLNVVVKFFNSIDFLRFTRELTGDPELVMVGAQATRYLPGQFLRLHDDHEAVENRRFAYVINLSRDWEADWGGMLHFVGPDGGIQEVYLPRFNTLSLFRVPAQHFVSLVSPWAKRPRLAITGWWHARPTPR